MTHSDWEAVFARSPIGGDEWYGYGYWLRDEADAPGAADALAWLLAAGKYPCYQEKGIWLWASPGKARIILAGRWHEPPPPHCVLPGEVHDALEGRVSSSGDRRYPTRTAAMLGAVRAAAVCGKRPREGA